MGRKIEISPLSCIAGAALLMFLPIRWLFGAFLAASVHELAHLAAIRLTGGQVTHISIGLAGAKIETMVMSRGREALCAAAGPLGSLMLAFGLTGYPEASVCAAVHGLYNLLPIYPLDGGRILHCLLPEQVCRGIEVFSVVMLLGLGIWLCEAYSIGILPLIPGFAALIWLLGRKIPCKEPKQAVQ